MIFKNIPTKNIFPSKENVRKTYFVDDLVESIKSIGLLCPIAVREKDKHYEIIHGHRRWGAYKKLKYSEIPCVIFPEIKDNTELLLMRLVENVVRNNLTPQEEANVYYELCKNRGFSIRQISDKTGIPKSTIHRKMQFLKFPLFVQEKIESGELSHRGTKEFMKASETIKDELIKEALAKKLTVEEIEFKRKAREDVPSLLKDYKKFIEKFIEEYKKYNRTLLKKMNYNQKQEWNKIYSKLKMVIFSWDGMNDS